MITHHVHALQLERLDDADILTNKSFKIRSADTAPVLDNNSPLEWSSTNFSFQLVTDQQACSRIYDSFSRHDSVTKEHK